MAVTAPSSRVILAGLPRLTGDLVEAALASFDDVTVVGRCADPDEIAALVKTTAANVVVVGTEQSGLPHAYAELVAERLPPDTVVLPLDGGDVRLVVVRPRCVNLGAVSTSELGEVIRNTVSQRGAR
jgi:hypothetical protein